MYPPGTPTPHSLTHPTTTNNNNTRTHARTHTPPPPPSLTHVSSAMTVREANQDFKLDDKYLITKVSLEFSACLLFLVSFDFWCCYPFRE